MAGDESVQLEDQQHLPRGLPQVATDQVGNQLAGVRLVTSLAELAKILVGDAIGHLHEGGSDDFVDVGKVVSHGPR
ncbi:hypothetical protein D3C75_1332110 [compost metagenome]